MHDAIVIGAGVIGVTTAYALARNGASVMLVDRAERPGLGASFANGAQLSYAYTEALASPALLGKLPALALGLDPLFRLRPGLDPGLCRWLISFLSNMTAARFTRNTLDVLELALASQAEMLALRERHPFDFAYTVPGKMHLYYSARALRDVAAVVALKQRHGADQQILDASAAMAIEPALAHSHGLVGVVHSPSDAVGDAQQFCAGLSAICQDKLGMTICLGCTVARLERARHGWTVATAAGERLSARRLIICAGAQSRGIARSLGFALPIQPMKGYSFTAKPGPAAPRVSITDTKRKIVICRLGAQLRVAGLAELGNGSATVDPARARLLRALASETLPGVIDGVVEHEWAGLRPMTPSSRPIIRWIDPTLAVNSGHGMLGWTLAMGSAARLVSAMPELPNGSYQ